MRKSVYLSAGMMLLSLMLTACSSLSFLPGRSTQTIIQPDWEENRTSYRYVPGIILVETNLYDQEIRRNGTETLELMLDRLNSENMEKPIKTATVALHLRSIRL